MKCETPEYPNISEISCTEIFGRYDDSDIIKKYVAKDEIPTDGYLVKVIPNPEDDEGRFVILTAHNEQELFYAAAS